MYGEINTLIIVKVMCKVSELQTTFLVEIYCLFTIEPQVCLHQKSCP